MSRRAAKELTILANERVTDDEGSLLLETKSGTEWWTFAGLRGNAALAYGWNFPATYDNLSIRTPASAVEVRKAIEDSGESSPPEPNRRGLPTFSECLPEGLLSLFAWHRDYDRSAPGVIRENPVIAGRG
jgi:hypothetical protein